MRILISTTGQNLIDSGYSLRQYAENSVVNNLITTITGSINQFVQGSHNTVTQNNNSSAENLFAELLDFLREHGETAVVDEASETQKVKGIRAALSRISNKCIEGFTGTLAT